MGFVEIFGKVVPATKQILKSPFTNKDCVYYHCIIEESTDNKNRNSWSVVKQIEKGIPFYLKDNTGKVLVDPKGAKITLFQDHPKGIPFYLKDNTKKVLIDSKGAEITLFEGHVFYSKADLDKFLKSKIFTSKFNIFGLKTIMRYREYFIEPNDKLYVLGTAGDNPYIKNGNVQKNEEDIMIQKEKSLYYISDKDEKGVLNSFNWKIAGGIFLGLILLIESLVIISYLVLF